jgi:Flp pilus assembly protein TadD
MAKPMLVTVPFVLLLVDYWPLGRLKFGPSEDTDSRPCRSTKPAGYQETPAFRLVLEKVPLFGLSAVLICVSAFSVHHPGHDVVVSTEAIPMTLRIANALVSYVAYMGKMIWPHNLAVFYPYPHSLPMWQTAGAGLFLVMVSVLVMLGVRRRPYLGVGWLWYLGTLVPVIGLVQAGLWPAVADRFVYVPLIGLFIIIAWGLLTLAGRWSHGKIVIPILTGVLLAMFMTRTWSQVGYWKTSLALFQHAVEVTSKNHVAHNYVGLALAEQEKPDEAIPHFRKAAQIKPNYAAAHHNMGAALTRKGRLHEALFHFSRAVEIKPDHAQACYSLGIVCARQGRIDEATAYYLEALQIKPDFAEACNDLGIALAARGRLKEAIAYFSRAIRINADFAEAHGNLSRAYWLVGDKALAMREYEVVKSLNVDLAKEVSDWMGVH